MFTYFTIEKAAQQFELDRVSIHSGDKYCDDSRSTKLINYLIENKILYELKRFLEMIHECIHIHEVIHIHKYS